MNAITTTYASKNSAVRAAKRAGLTDCIIELINGRWVIVPATAKPSVRKSAVPQAQASKADKKSQSQSSIANPVAFIWQWLAQGDNARLRRRDAVAALVALGVAPGTAGTQRQRFLTASKDERKARASRYSNED